MSPLQDLDRLAIVRVLAELKAAGLTHRQIATEMSVTPETIRRWSLGDAEPRYSEGVWLRQRLTSVKPAQENVAA